MKMIEPEEHAIRCPIPFSKHTFHFGSSTPRNKNSSPRKLRNSDDTTNNPTRPPPTELAAPAQTRLTYRQPSGSAKNGKIASTNYLINSTVNNVIRSRPASISGRPALRAGNATQPSSHVGALPTSQIPRICQRVC